LKLDKEQKNNNIRVNDIAEYLKLSASTVSRALKNHPKISQRTKEKVWTAAQELGYSPNIPAYMLQNTDNIVLIFVENFETAFNRAVVRGAQKYLSERGFQVLLRLIDDEKFFEDAKNIKTSLNINSVGIIAIYNNILDNHHKKIEELEMPIVSINKWRNLQANVNIIPDIYNGAYLAAEHLKKRKSKNIALIVGDDGSPVYEDMINGFKLAFEDNQNYYIRQISLSETSLSSEFQYLLQSSLAIDSIITCDNFVSHRLYNFLRTMDIEVPEDLMLVSFGKDESIFYKTAGITTIEYSSKKIGERAAKELFGVMRDKHIKDRVIVEPVKLVIRSSSMRIL
jgi:LacI family transcriptional regulator